MRLFTLLLFPLLLSLSPVRAQLFERSLPIGFSAGPTKLVSGGPNRWLVTSRGVEAPGKLFADTLALLVFDDQANLSLRHTVVLPPGEVFRILDALPTADGGFVISFLNTLCDIIGGAVTLRKLDMSGQIQWEVGGDLQSLSAPPSRLALAPDGNLLGLNYRNRLGKYAINTGELLWSAELVLPPGLNYLNISDYSFLAGTESMIAIGKPVLQRWEPGGSPNAPVYSLAQYSDLPQAGLSNLVPGPDNTFYAIQKNSTQFFTIDGDDLSLHPLDLDVPFDKVQDFAVTENGLLVMGRSGDTNHLLEFDTAGMPVHSFPAPQGALEGNFLAVADTTVAIAGTDRYGVSGNQQFPWGDTRHLWFRTMTRQAAGPVQPVVDAGITDISMEGDIVVTATPTGFDPDQNVYTLTGGNFRVKVTNFGPNVLDQVYVGTRFQPDQGYFICFYIPAHQRHYTGLNLAPGASVWLDFGDIEAANQGEIPAEFCFWTSAPETRPDADRANDVFCIGSTLDAPEAGTTNWRIYPNPVTDGLYLEDLPPTETYYEIYTALGQVVRQGPLDPGSRLAYVSTDGLAGGVYLVRTPTGQARFLVQR